MIVTDTYYDEDQQIFVNGLQDLQTRSLDNYGAHFQVVAVAQRLALLQTLDAEQHRYMQTCADGAPVHYFRMIKELSLLGNFTSEIGYMQAMRYTETPGRFDPCVSYADREKAWTRHA